MQLMGNDESGSSIISLTALLAECYYEGYGVKQNKEEAVRLWKQACSESNAVKLFNDEEVVIFPKTTAIGSLPYYITHTDSKHFQPMNVTFGIVEELEGPRIRDKKERYTKVAERALNSLTDIISKDNL